MRQVYGQLPNWKAIEDAYEEIDLSSEIGGGCIGDGWAMVVHHLLRLLRAMPKGSEYS